MEDKIIYWLKKRIQQTETERKNAVELPLIIGKGAKLTVYKECLNHIIVEQNKLKIEIKLIANFMGIDVTKSDDISDGTLSTMEYYLNYRSSWSMIMPVWKKIVDIGDNIGSKVRIAYFTKIKHSLYVCDIDGVVDGIVEFIKWYNIWNKKK